jgi:integrase
MPQRPRHNRTAPGTHRPPLPPGTTWSSALLPTLANLEPLRAYLPAAAADSIIRPEATTTPFEATIQSGRLRAAAATINTNNLAAMATAFDNIIAPAIVMPNTRARYFAQWRTLVTFAWSLDALQEILPLSQQLLKAFILAAVLAGYRVPSIMGFLTAFKHRHRIQGLTFQIPSDTVTGWTTALRRNRGLPTTPKFKVLPSHIKAALMRPISSLTHLRDILIVAIGTTCALRAGEIRDLDICDASWDHDGPNTLMLRIKLRKQAKGREGLYPRIGAARESRFDIIKLLKMYTRWARLSISPSCSKNAHPAESCEACGSLFRTMHPSGRKVSAQRIAKNIVTDAVRRQLSAIGINTAGYSAISMRKGGVSAAVCAGIPHDLRRMQTGHKSSAWEHYFDLADHGELYRFFDVFGL